MFVKRVSPQDAQALLEREGYLHLDVRSKPEFDAGHPTGAYNIPLLHMGPSGMQPNPDFLAVVEATFDKKCKLVVGCRSGARSLQAARMLLEAGYETVVDQRAGFEGARDNFGQLQQPGWKPAGLPVSATPKPGRSYEALVKSAGKG